MTPDEFVTRLDEENQALLRRLEPEATLKPEAGGDSVAVSNVCQLIVWAKSALVSKRRSAPWRGPLMGRR